MGVMEAKRKVILAIMDGVGLRDGKSGNAVKLAKPRFLNGALKRFPNVQLAASEQAVGLPAGQIGNSEVGHQNIGAGRVVLQELLKIDKSIETGEFFDNAVLNQMLDEVKSAKSNLHIIGVMSNGGVHGALNHILALLKMTKSKRFKSVFLHIITDGRDTLPNVSDSFYRQLRDYIDANGYGQVVSISGRYYAMDREGHFDRTKLAYDAIVRGEGTKINDVGAYIDSSFKENIFDEFIKPASVRGYGGFCEGDVVFCCNFRADRARQLVYSLSDSKFDVFKTCGQFKTYSMTSYGDKCDKCGVKCAFSQHPIKNNLTETVSKAGGSVLKVAETTKYAHVTYFLNGLREKPYKNEDRILHPSDNVATFDLAPQMQAKKIAKSVVAAAKGCKYDLIVLNFANGDMVGHTGNLKAAIKAVKAVDGALKTIFKHKNDYTLIITADHGNAELMRDENGKTITSHTLNKVPFVVCDTDVKLKNGEFALSNIAPTVLELMQIKIPKEMTSESMVKRD